MAELTVSRKYRVDIPDEDLDRIEATEFGSSDLIDAATRCCDADSLEGILYWIQGPNEDYADPSDRGDYWCVEQVDGDVILDQVAYKVEEVDVTIG